MDELFRSHYFDRQGNPISFAEGAALLETGDRVVRRTELGDGVLVSTVHLVIDYSFGRSPPVIFETMVFRNGDGEYERRYSTEAEAMEGHDQVVAEVEALLEIRRDLEPGSGPK